ncbi:MAG: DUF4080 domain-containing protein [Oscillospiraceae bacterium]|nr:DUF4080 domain-containing protein [Oscillospiraceae bacterium]
MRLDAAICCLSAKYVHASLAPWCLLAGVRAYAPGLRVKVVESTVNRPLEETAKTLEALAPRAVAFCCYIWNIGALKKLLPEVRRRLPGAAIVLGGPEVSYRPVEALAELPEADYILCGEGEKPFPLFLKALRGEGAFSEVPGLCAKGDSTAPTPYIGEDEPPSPYTREYFEALGGRIAYLETSRGCPYRCAFCLSGRCGGVRFFSLQRAKSEMLALAQSGAQTVKLVDRTFNCNRARAKELWRFVIDQQGKGVPPGVCFHFEIAGDILDEESIEILNAAPPGSIQLEIGMQSFYPPTLEAVRRRTDCARLCENIRRLVKPGNLHIHIDLIAGLPYEGLAEFRESFDTGYQLGSHMLQLGFLKLLPGSELREKAEEYGLEYEQEAPYEVTRTRWLDETELALLHGVEAAAERLCNSGRFLRTLTYVLGQSGLSPFCLFEGLAKAAGCAAGVSLDAYTALAKSYFETLPGVEPERLRDELVLDRLASAPGGRLPPCLYKKDPRLKKAALWLQAGAWPRKRGMMRGIALLYGRGALAAVDYDPALRNPVTGRWPVKLFTGEEIYDV